MKENLKSKLSEEFVLINEINNECVDLLMEDKVEESLKKLIKLESNFKSLINQNKKEIDNKIMILILHNIACCYQKLKNFESCIYYLKAVILNYDNMLEKKHGIKIGLNGRRNKI